MTTWCFHSTLLSNSRLTARATEPPRRPMPRETLNALRYPRCVPYLYFLEFLQPPPYPYPLRPLFGMLLYRCIKFFVSLKPVMRVQYFRQDLECKTPGKPSGQEKEEVGCHRLVLPPLLCSHFCAAQLKPEVGSKRVLVCYSPRGEVKENNPSPQATHAGGLGGCSPPCVLVLRRRPHPPRAAEFPRRAAEQPGGVWGGRA